MVNYCQWDPRYEPVCMGLNGRGYCHPGSFAPLPNTLYRNNGDGTFTDVSAETGISTVLGKGMGVVFADYDGDGFLDVFVANDNSPNLLFHNLGGKRFEEVGFQAGVAYNDEGTALAGMGADFRDLNNDGLTGHLAYRDRKRNLSFVHQRGQRTVSQCESSRAGLRI